jgi:hypothetical protein
MSSTNWKEYQEAKRNYKRQRNLTNASVSGGVVSIIIAMLIKPLPSYTLCTNPNFGHSALEPFTELSVNTVSVKVWPKVEEPFVKFVNDFALGARFNVHGQCRAVRWHNLVMHASRKPSSAFLKTIFYSAGLGLLWFSGELNDEAERLLRLKELAKARLYK